MSEYDEMTNMAPEYWPAQPHALESERLQELERLRILDTEDEERFDRLTRLICKVTGFPTAMVSLVDKDRQWFKSVCNSEIRETPRDVAFCAHAINEDTGMLIVPDAGRDPRFRASPLVMRNPNIRAYAGVVLRSPKGLPLGTFCIVDYEPRVITDDMIDVLREFADIVEAELLKNTGNGNGADAKSSPRAGMAQPVMTAREFQTAADGLCHNAKACQFVVMALEIPKIRSIRRTFGRETRDMVRDEIVCQLRIVLGARRFLLAADDEGRFVGLFDLNEGEAELERLRSELQSALTQRILIGDTVLTTPIGVGLACAEGAADTLEDALQRANLALDSLGNNYVGAKICVFHDGIDQVVVRRSVIASILQRAIENDELDVYYQPKVSLANNRIIGAEALIRWYDPVLGYVSPPEIFDAAREVDLVVDLDEWVFHHVCKSIVEQRTLTGRQVPISINITGDTLARDDFVDWACSVLDEYALDTKAVDFEILESVILDDADDAIGKLKAARDRGIPLSLDDFGTGQSSLSYLQRLPIDTLKIDKSFIDRIVFDTASSAMANQIIGIGHSLGKKVITEGVEDIGQYLILRAFGCDAIQGYLCAKPMAEKDFVDHLIGNGGTYVPDQLKQFQFN